MTKNKSHNALIIDDEPEYLDWVVEFFDSIGLKTDLAKNLDEALKLVTDSKKYLIIIVDMNIPSLDFESSLSAPLEKKYPGLFAINKFRNLGYWPTQTIAYTVHDDDLLETELNRFNCRYVLKGRPNILKSVVKQSLEIILEKRDEAEKKAFKLKYKKGR